MYKQKLIMPLITWGSALITYLFITVLSWKWPALLYSTYDVTKSAHPHVITQSTAFDSSLAIVTLLACISLIIPFRIGIPKIVCWGLHAYFWLLGVAFCYIASGNSRIVWYVLSFPLPKTLYWLFFSLVISALLILFRKNVGNILNYLMKPQTLFDQSIFNGQYTQPEGQPLYRRKFFTPLLVWGCIILTLLSFFFLSRHETHIYYSGIAYLNFDMGMWIVIAIACLSLVSSFRSSEVKTAYWGLHSYLWCIALAICYLRSGNVREILYGLSIPLLSTLPPVFLFALLGSIFLFIFRTHIIRLLAYLFEIPLVMKHTTPRTELAYQAYQQGHQAINDPRPFHNNDYEQPQASYPHEMPGQQQ